MKDICLRKILRNQNFSFLRCWPKIVVSIGIQVLHQKCLNSIVISSQHPPFSMMPTYIVNSLFLAKWLLTTKSTVSKNIRAINLECYSLLLPKYTKVLLQLLDKNWPLKKINKLTPLSMIRSLLQSVREDCKTSVLKTTIPFNKNLQVKEQQLSSDTYFTISLLKFILETEVYSYYSIKKTTGLLSYTWYKSI